MNMNTKRVIKSIILHWILTQLKLLIGPDASCLVYQNNVFTFNVLKIDSYVDVGNGCISVVHAFICTKVNNYSTVRNEKLL